MNLYLVLDVSIQMYSSFECPFVVKGQMAQAVHAMRVEWYRRVVREGSTSRGYQEAKLLSCSLQCEQFLRGTKLSDRNFRADVCMQQTNESQTIEIDSKTHGLVRWRFNGCCACGYDVSISASELRISGSNLRSARDRAVRVTLGAKCSSFGRPGTKRWVACMHHLACSSPIYLTSHV